MFSLATHTITFKRLPFATLRSMIEAALAKEECLKFNGDIESLHIDREYDEHSPNNGRVAVFYTNLKPYTNHEGIVTTKPFEVYDFCCEQDEDEDEDGNPIITSEMHISLYHDLYGHDQEWIEHVDSEDKNADLAAYYTE